MESKIALLGKELEMMMSIDEDKKDRKLMRRQRMIDDNKRFEEERRQRNSELDKQEAMQYQFCQLERMKTAKQDEDDQEKREDEIEVFQDFARNQQIANEDKMKRALKTAKIQREIREAERVRDLDRNKKDRQARTHDRQIEADKNMTRFKDFLSASTIAHQTQTECDINKLEAQGRNEDKKLQYLHDYDSYEQNKKQLNMMALLMLTKK